MNKASMMSPTQLEQKNPRSLNRFTTIGHVTTRVVIQGNLSVRDPRGVI